MGALPYICISARQAEVRWPTYSRRLVLPFHWNANTRLPKRLSELTRLHKIRQSNAAVLDGLVCRRAVWACIHVMGLIWRMHYGRILVFAELSGPSMLQLEFINARACRKLGSLDQ
jgi:hypothetical protein